MVQFKNVTKVYPNGLAAVKDVDFFIDEGEFVFLIGPSGSGKTTLIELLIRDQKPSDGRIYLNDYDITHISRSGIYQLRRQIGVIFQDYKLIEDKTAYENVSFAMEAAGKKKKEIKETVPYVLDVVGLSDRMKAFPVQLSGGEQQRVAIARAIANNPKLLIADEPTGNLDPASAWDIVQVLTKINNWGTTVIMSTHGTDIVNTLNKRVIQMEKGVIVRDDNEGQYEFSSEKEESEIKEIMQEAESTKSAKAKNTFKVNLSNKPKTEQEQQVQQKGGFFTKLFGKKKNEIQQPISIVDELESETEPIEAEKVVVESEDVEKEVGETEIKDSEVQIEEIKDEKPTDEELDTKKEENAKPEEIKETEEKVNTGLAKSRKKIKDSTKKKPGKLEKDLDKKLKEYSDMSVDYLNLPSSIINDLKKDGYNTIGKIIQDGPEKLTEKIDIDSEEVIMIAKALEKIVKT